MDSESANSSSQPPPNTPDDEPPNTASDVLHSQKASIMEPAAPTITGHDSSAHELPPSLLSPSITLSWAKSLKLSQPQPTAKGPQTGNAGMSTFARFTSGLGLRLPTVASTPEENTAGTSSIQTNVIESFTKGIVDSSRNAVKAMQVKARHIVSQNKRRYQEGGFDLDMTYITENIIAMGFPAGDISSGFFGYFEGFYRNHMEEVIKFFETHHKGKYKVYNLCSERLYDAALFQGKVACFPFDDHNCPPIQLISSFCQSAYSWLKEDIQNVVVVHCKAGMARTGLMICGLLLFLKFFPTAEEAIDYYNQKRCVDGKALVLPSQIRYVKYFEHILTNFSGENQPGRRCMLRGFKLQNCPYWIRPSITISNHRGVLFSTRKHPRTKDLMPEDFWISVRKKKILVFALPGEPGLTELVGDFKIHFHDRQGDFYCWLNTTMTENKKILNDSDLDGFEKRKVPSPGFQVEVVMIDYNGTLPTRPKTDSTSERSGGRSAYVSFPSVASANSNQSKVSKNEDDDDVFSDSDGEGTAASKSRQAQDASGVRAPSSQHVSNNGVDQMGALTRGADQLSLKRSKSNNSSEEPTANEVGKLALDSMGASDIKAIAADASVFSFGDEEDYESE